MLTCIPFTTILNVFRLFSGMILILSLATVTSAQNDQKTSLKKPIILVLGVYHLSSNGEDVTSPKRQKEISDLLALLK